MKLSDFDYELPKHFIAQTPAMPRDSSKLLIYNRADNTAEIKHFYDIIDYLEKGDVIVINTTKVIPARLLGHKNNSEVKIEVLLLKKIENNLYEVLVKPLKRLGTGDKVIFGQNTVGELVSKDETAGTARMRFNTDACGAGEVPLPHYITEKLDDKNRYQTVYGDTDGSAAAPTAGLHWTPELMQKAKDKGVIFCEILLHVGPGTFRPVKTDNIEDHKMHTEYYEVSARAADIINAAKHDKRRVICVGTTSVRTLESVFQKFETIKPDRGETDIFIYPPYKFNTVDALVTNFHLPKSSLLMLVSAFAGREKTLELYETAKYNNFRFFSFGDVCLIL